MEDARRQACLSASVPPAATLGDRAMGSIIMIRARHSGRTSRVRKHRIRSGWTAAVVAPRFPLFAWNKVPVWR